MKLNPGSVAVRLGSVLQKYEDAMTQTDLATAANMLDLAASYVSVHMTAKTWKQYEDLPGFNYGDDRTAQEIFKALNNRLRFILAQAKKANLFARDTVAAVDASGLDFDQE